MSRTMPALVLPASLMMASLRCSAAAVVGRDPAHGSANQHQVGPGHAVDQFDAGLANRAGLAGDLQVFHPPADADNRLGQPAPRHRQSDRAPDQTDPDNGHTTKQAHGSAAILSFGFGQSDGWAGRGGRPGFHRLFSRGLPPSPRAGHCNKLSLGVYWGWPSAGRRSKLPVFARDRPARAGLVPIEAQGLARPTSMRPAPFSFAGRPG
jgi:hypothetical protein